MHALQAFMVFTARCCVFRTYSSHEVTGASIFSTFRANLQFSRLGLQLQTLGGFKSEVQHLPPSKVRRCKAPQPGVINNSSLKTA